MPAGVIRVRGGCLPAVSAVTGPFFRHLPPVSRPGRRHNAGGAAVKAAFEGRSGQVITLKRVSDDPYMCITEPAPVGLIANIEKKVPPEWITEDGRGVTSELKHYIFPLIQAEIEPLWVDGLPRHIRLMK